MQKSVTKYAKRVNIAIGGHSMPKTISALLSLTVCHKTSLVQIVFMGLRLVPWRIRNDA